MTRAETSASRCLRNFHHMSWRCEATKIRRSSGSATGVGPRGACTTAVVVPLTSTGMSSTPRASEALPASIRPNRRRSSLAEPDARIQPGEQDVADQGADDGQDAEHEYEAAGHVH